MEDKLAAAEAALSRQEYLTAAKLAAEVLALDARSPRGKRVLDSVVKVAPETSEALERSGNWPSLRAAVACTGCRARCR